MMLWDETRALPAGEEIPDLPGVRFSTIQANDPSADGFHFLHGVTVTAHGGRLFSTWANNRGEENTQTEVVRWSRSDDDGATWSPPRLLPPPEDGCGSSHGALLSVQGELWGFFPRFTGLREHVRTYAYRLSDGDWREIGCISPAPFWPLGEPRRLPDGDWIMPGLWVGGAWGGTENPPAVARCGGDFSRWTVVPVPKPAEQVLWGECGILEWEGGLLCVSRCWHAHPVALQAFSRDGGRTWTELADSNLPMADSKPCAGNLRDGRGYLIGTNTADGGAGRYPLTLVLSGPDGGPFRTVQAIRRCRPGHDRALRAGERMLLSYPYAAEADGKLYVAYSVGIVGERVHNDANYAELAVIPLEALPLGESGRSTVKQP